jgi:glycosyltransferase involved in cell wall biosynthesis
LILCPTPLHGRAIATAEQAVHVFARLPTAAFHGIPALMPRLRFCGTGTGIERLIRAARRDHVEDRVDFRPARDLAELRTIYASATCCLLPDSAGPAMEDILDALSSGRPCVAFARGAASEVLSPRNSVLADDPEPAALSAALAECLVRLRDTDEIWRDVQPFDYTQLRSTLLGVWS